ncbi:MAG: OmpA family protein [Crocinitomicaceae bacterium]|nr:OmpA family protein [Crocinitomicaceae bacterium]
MKNLEAFCDLAWYLYCTFTGMKRFGFIYLGFWLLTFGISSFGQLDTVKVGLDTYVIIPAGTKINYDSLFAINPQVELNPQFYIERYKEGDLMYKITDNKGNGFDSLYGTRNMRPVLHGVAYRGGANNYYHLTDKRDNQNPLPLDGMHNLCQEGFSGGIYLYRKGIDEYPMADTCSCIDQSWNTFNYHQLDYFDSTHVYEMMKMTYLSATNPEIGPIYLHCWNGWHASGYVSAVMLKQFCEFSNWDAVNYWDLGTDGANTSPRYQEQRERIKNFEPYPEFMISDSLQKCLCPEMPKNIDSSQLHVEIEHLVVVPEAIPVGFQIVLYNVIFAPGRTTFAGIENNPDVVYLMQALDVDPNLVIEIGGYTDASGSYSENVSLSTQRAKFIYDFLITKGYAPERISYKGYGPANPIYSNKYKSTREGNRRIEVKIINKTQHAGNQLVDESVYENNANVVDAEKLKKMSLSYFFANQGSSELGSVFIIDSLNFPSSMATLPTSGIGKENLDKLVTYLKENKYVKITINGYTDASGIEENNIVLSDQRAKAVYDYLIANGISASRLSYKGHGSQNPIAPNRYKWGRDINRRIEIEFVAD